MRDLRFATPGPLLACSRQRHYKFAMRLALRLHPDSRCVAASRIEVDVARPRPGQLALRYVVTGTMSDLRLPPASTPTRSDELWRHTCFEVFLRATGSAGYREFNFAPSTQWAAYRFDNYRSGMQAVSEMDAPRFETRRDDTHYELRVTLALDRLAGVPNDASWQLGLSAVIEETGGAKSYWALAHPPGRADFHHSDCFALELPAA